MQHKPVVTGQLRAGFFFCLFFFCFFLRSARIALRWSIPDFPGITNTIATIFRSVVLPFTAFATFPYKLTRPPPYSSVLQNCPHSILMCPNTNPCICQCSPTLSSLHSFVISRHPQSISVFPNTVLSLFPYPLTPAPPYSSVPLYCPHSILMCTDTIPVITKSQNLSHKVVWRFNEQLLLLLKAMKYWSIFFANILVHPGRKPGFLRNVWKREDFHVLSTCLTCHVWLRLNAGQLVTNHFYGDFEIGT